MPELLSHKSFATTPDEISKACYDTWFRRFAEPEIHRNAVLVALAAAGWGDLAERLVAEQPESWRAFESDRSPDSSPAVLHPDIRRHGRRRARFTGRLSLLAVNSSCHNAGMPCIPSYHEQMWDQASLGLRIAQQELTRLVPMLEQAKTVVAAALAQAPELAAPGEASSWLALADDLLARARACTAPKQAPSTTDEVEAWAAVASEQMGLYRAVEQHVCVAGTLAHRAKHVATPAQKPAWDGLLTHHEDHREADRRAMLADLWRRHADLEQRYDAALDAARRVVHARGDYFDDVTSREDAVRDEAGPAAAAMCSAQRELRAEIERIKALSLDELCARRDAL